MQSAALIGPQEEWAVSILDHYGCRMVALMTGKTALVIRQLNEEIKQAYLILGGADWVKILPVSNMAVPKAMKPLSLYCEGSAHPGALPEEVLPQEGPAKMPWEV